MLSGRRLDLLDPSPLDIEIDDIGHGLARVPRWNGQTAGRHVFSVAQHSLFVESIAGEMSPDLPESARLAILLHDGAEYVIGDIITPLKSVLGDGYAGVEARLRAAIHIRFGLRPEPARELAQLTKNADRVAAYFEATQLAGFASDEADEFFGRPALQPQSADEFLSSWPTDKAERRFRARFRALFPASIGGRSPDQHQRIL